MFGRNLNCKNSFVFDLRFFVSNFVVRLQTLYAHTHFGIRTLELGKKVTKCKNEL